MNELVKFLMACLAEDEQIARKAAAQDGERWRQGDDTVGSEECQYIATGPYGCGLGDIGPHIARHDPERILLEVESKRKLVAWFAPPPREPETNAQLHARCAHPEWEYATTEGQRKAFDDYDVPPYDPETHEPDHTWDRSWRATTSAATGPGLR